MKEYNITITANKYPTHYSVRASNWHTAVARGVKEWRKRFAREVVNELLILAIRSSIPEKKKPEE